MYSLSQQNTAFVAHRVDDLEISKTLTAFSCHVAHRVDDLEKSVPNTLCP